MVEDDFDGGGVSLWSTTRRSVLTEISFFRARFQHFFLHYDGISISSGN